MTGTEQHTGSGGGGMDEDRRLTITWSYKRTWRRLRYRQAAEDITECTALIDNRNRHFQVGEVTVFS